MKTRNIYSIAMMAAVLSACQVEVLEQDNAADQVFGEVELSEGQILAVTPTAADTKIGYGAVVEGVYPVVWTVNEDDPDKIMLYSNDGSESAEYTLNSSSDEVSSAVFEGEPVSGTSRYAVFPASSAKGLADGNVTIDFACIDKMGYHSKISGNGDNLKYLPMYAKEDAANPGVFTFENLCGIVSFRFNDYQELNGMEITEVKIVSKNKYIAGIGSFDGENLVMTGTKDSQKQLTVSYSTGLPIGSSKASPSIDDAGVPGYLFALPVGTYPANDLTVVIKDDTGRVFTRTITKEFTVEAGVAKAFPVLPFTFSYGEANCFVVEPGKTETFDVAARYSFDKSLAVTSMSKVQMEDEDNPGTYVDYVGTDLSVKTLWQIEEAGTVLTGSVLSSVSLDDNTLSVTAGSTSGNALVALVKTVTPETGDPVETILWSWHIWVVDGLTDHVYTGKTGEPTFLDRNLGATTNDDSNDAFGLYYQYGRKDPFVVNKETLAELTPTVAKTNGETAKLSYTIKHPDTRIKGNVKHWIDPLSEAEGLWGSSYVLDDVANIAETNVGYKSIYDPCPEGYRVPDFYHVSELGMTYTFKYDGTNEITYPACGTIQNSGDAVSSSDDVHGYYWTTTLTTYTETTTTYQSAAVYGYTTGTFVAKSSLKKMSAYRTQANNVRCLKIAE